MAKRREPPAGASAGKDKDRKLPAELVALGEAVKLENRPELSGSASGAFTYALLSGAVWALDHHAQPDQGSRDVKQLAVRAFLKEVAPRDPLEGMLAAQLLGLHEAAMECLRRGAMAGQTFEGRQANLGQAGKLTRSYAVLLEALGRHRGKGQPQVVRVERVTVEAGGQAIVGAVSQGGGGSGAGSDERPHAPGRLAHEPGVPLRCADAVRKPVPVAGGAGQAAVPDARRDGG
jgi:hypothetical protein